MTIRPDFSFELAAKESFAAVLIPGGDPRSAVGNTELRQILQNANNGKTVIAAICAGPLLLGDAGILKGKRVAHGYQKKQFEIIGTYFEGATMTDKPVEVDGRVITAKPNAFVDFSIELACAVGILVEKRRIEFLRRYYHGLNPGLQPLAGVNSVYFYVRDVFDSMGWYQRLFMTDAESSGGDVAFLRVGHQQIFFCASDDKSAPSTGGSIINWWTEQLDRTLERSKSLGADVLRGPIELADGRCIYHLRDPHGNAFGLEGYPVPITSL